MRFLDGGEDAVGNRKTLTSTPSTGGQHDKQEVI